MDKTKLALIKIEEAFGTITRRFDERMERVIRAEHTRINHMIAERRRKLAAKRKELIELGLPVRKSILNAEIRTTKAIFDIPEHIAATQDRSHLLAYVEDLENMKIHVEEYCKFLAALKDSNNQILYDTAFELLPKAQRLISLLHLYKAHPDDVVKRANKIINPSLKDKAND